MSGLDRTDYEERLQDNARDRLRSGEQTLRSEVYRGTESCEFNEYQQSELVRIELVRVELRTEL